MSDAMFCNARAANDDAQDPEGSSAVESEGLFVEWVRACARRVRPGQRGWLTLLAVPCLEAC